MGDVGIDIVVAKWVAEHEAWQKELDERVSHGKTLRPKRQALYDAFVASPNGGDPSIIRMHLGCATLLWAEVARLVYYSFVIDS